MIEILFFLVVHMGNGTAVVPIPYVTEKACITEMKRINKSSSDGGMPNGHGYCIRVEAKKKD